MYFALYVAAHVGGTYKEYLSIWATEAKAVNLMSHIVTISIDRFLTLEVRDGVASEL